MVSMHVHFPSSWYFVAFVCVFSVILCVSVPCDKPLCGWSGCPVAGARPVAGTHYPVAGTHYPVAGVILTVVEENHPVAVVACLVARVMQKCVAQVTSKSTVIGSLVDCPFACRIVADALSGRNNGSQSRLCTIYGMFVYNPCCCMKISALHVPVDVYIFRYRPAHEAFVDKKIPYHMEKGPLVATARPFT